jgi:hypothetical protein
MEMGAFFNSVCLWPQASWLFSWEIMRNYLTLPGLCPAALKAPVAMVLYYL